MTEEQMKQWAADLLEQQRKEFMNNFPPAAPQQPEPTYSFEDDPEKAVSAMLQKQIDQFLNPVQQQIKTMSEQVEQLSQKNSQQAADFMKLLVPDAKPDESFDKEPAGFGALTWGQLRSIAEQNGDVDGLKQYAEALSQFKGRSGDQEIPSSKSRAAAPRSTDQPQEASEEEVNEDLMRVMNGQMPKEDFDKKYGVAS